jgi:hypothetical protein
MDLATVSLHRFCFPRRISAPLPRRISRIYHISYSPRTSRTHLTYVRYPGPPRLTHDESHCTDRLHCKFSSPSHCRAIAPSTIVCTRRYRFRMHFLFWSRGWKAEEEFQKVRGRPDLAIWYLISDLILVKLMIPSSLTETSKLLLGFQDRRAFF